VSAPPRLELPFRRLALVLPGGGALGAYEVGVLRVLDSLGIAPSIVVGVSIGAINAVGWLAAGRGTAALEQVWRSAGNETLGVQWVSLALRVTGALTVLLAFLEVVLGATGSLAFSGAQWLWRRPSAGADLVTAQLDLTLWLVSGLAGLLIVLFARRLAHGLERRSGEADPARARQRLRWTAIGAASLHALVWIMGWPWPYRFSAWIVLLLGLAWALSLPGLVGRAMRALALGFMPETGGRGLWGGRARRRIVERWIETGQTRRLVGPGTGLVVTALEIGSGRIVHFVSWPEPEAEFVERMATEQAEVVVLEDESQLLDAVVASSAIPGVFQPEPVAGRVCVDAGGYSNQPMHVAIAAGADAVLVTLLSPSESRAPAAPPADVLALGGRLLELMNWRDLQTELRNLPPGWSRGGSPARICVVEPREPLPATWLAFDPARARELIALGERDAREALARAGWVPAERPA
jgi:predicted acylesterase/phospholipase RssA